MQQIDINLNFEQIAHHLHQLNILVGLLDSLIVGLIIVIAIRGRNYD